MPDLLKGMGGRMHFTFVYVEILSALHGLTSSSPEKDNGARVNDRSNEGNNYTIQGLQSTWQFYVHFHTWHSFLIITATQCHKPGWQFYPHLTRKKPAVQTG